MESGLVDAEGSGVGDDCKWLLKIDQWFCKNGSILALVEVVM